MTKKADRWPLWKIVATTLGCAAGGGVLLWAGGPSIAQR